MTKLDLSEVSQEPFAFATRETLERSRPEPLLVWARSGALNAVLLESAHMIRKAVTYLRADVAQTGVNYMSLDVPGGARRGVSDEREPREVKRYLVWTREMLERRGSAAHAQVVNCIVEGSACPLELMRGALKRF